VELGSSASRSARGRCSAGPPRPRERAWGGRVQARCRYRRGRDLSRGCVDAPCFHRDRHVRQLCRLARPGPGVRELSRNARNPAFSATVTLACGVTPSSGHREVGRGGRWRFSPTARSWSPARSRAARARSSASGADVEQARASNASSRGELRAPRFGRPSRTDGARAWSGRPCMCALARNSRRLRWVDAPDLVYVGRGSISDLCAGAALDESVKS